MERHGFAHVKHETLHLTQWRRKHFELHHGMQSTHNHGNNEEGGSLQDLMVGHKCNGSPQELTNEQAPTLCTKQRKKHHRVGGKLE
jgi:hypothetical protein